MKTVGVPKEIKTNESRVALTPDGAKQLYDMGVQVFVESGAGQGVHLTDGMYGLAQAQICDAETAWNQDIVLKVKEPQVNEFKFFRDDMTLFTYLHLAAYPHVAQALCDSGATAIAYETVVVDNALPLLAPMSEIAGKLSAQVAARFLEKPQGGRGVLLSGATGVAKAKIMVLGAGNVGLNAALIASGMGADVELFDINELRLQKLFDEYGERFKVTVSSPEIIAEKIVDADAVIGGVLVPGGRAPIVVTKEMISTMKKGAVVVDTAIDQGGCIETSKETTHDSPTFEVDGVVHYAVGNMPGAVANTATFALTNATLPYVIELATNELNDAVDKIAGLYEGINVRNGLIANEDVKIALS